jgi:hypothetical protein
MQGTKGIAVVALAAAAAGGAAALLLSPGIGVAQEEQQQTPSDAPTDSTPAAPEMPADGSQPPAGSGCAPDGRGGPGLDAAAGAIGIDVEDLVTALRDGQTIAAVAEAHDVDPDDVVAAMVADAEAHLDQAVADGRLSTEDAEEIRADLPARIAELVENGPPAGGPTGPSGASPDSSPGARPPTSVSV